MSETDILRQTEPGTNFELDTPDETVAVAAADIPEVEPQVALVEIAIPVYNEELVLEESVRRLRGYLDTSFPFTAAIVIVDNASVDGTWEVATALSSQLAGVSAIHLDQKGRGRAIRTAWTASRSEVVAYMDVDLSTDLDGLLPLVAPLVSNHSQVAIGSRLAPGSRVLRGGKREFISRTYNLIVRGVLKSHFSDAECGFKAVRRDVIPRLLGLVEDQAWFFDTELLVQAERNGYRIHEVSVDWIDDPDSRVNIVNTATEDLKGVWRLARQRVNANGPFSSGESTPFDNLREMARYASVGILSTITYLAIFLMLRSTLGMLGANLVAAATTTLQHHGTRHVHISVQRHRTKQESSDRGNPVLHRWDWPDDCCSRRRLYSRSHVITR